MVTVSLSQAAKLVKRSKPTISKAIKDGRLSYVSKDERGYQIEVSELHRVFPPDTPTEPDTGTTSAPPDLNAALTVEARMLREALDREREERERERAAMQETVTDLRERLTRHEALIANHARPQSRWWPFRRKSE